MKDNDNITVANLVPNGFNIVYRNRKNRSGGGVAIIYRSSIEILSSKFETDFSTFESICLKIRTPDHKSCFLSCIYRPTKSKKNNAPFSEFLSDFNKFLECISCEQKVFILGDFNIHYEISNDPDAAAFKRLINEHDFTQSVNEPTHVKGHTLDLFLFRYSELFSPELLVDDICISDHHVITVPLPFSKPKPVTNTVNSRNIKAIDMQSFRSSLSDSLNCIQTSISSFSLTECVKSVLNKFAPIKTRLIKVRPAAPWINIFVKAQKQARRKAERLFKKTGLTVHKEIFRYHKNKTTKIINAEKKKYINEQITSSNNSKQLFSIFGKLTGKQSSLILPTDTASELLPDKFNLFFTEKIAKIRSDLDAFDSSFSYNDSEFSGDFLCQFDSVSSEHVKKIISNSKKSFCELDMLPEKMFLECNDILLPFITDIFNQAISNGIFPSDFKDSVVIPLLKKPSLDCNILKNYRPVSNLSFVSKLLERSIF